MSNFTNTISVLGDDAVVDSLINRSITEFSDDVITSLKGHAFSGCEQLTRVNLPKLTQQLQDGVFENCTALTEVNLPLLQSMRFNGFIGCTSLETIKLPSLITMSSYNFQNCTALRKVDLPVLSSAGGSALWDGCSRLTALILRKSDAIATLGYTTSFGGTPIESGTGYIYVPRALVDTYKAATNWSTYAAQFRALEDYTVDGTITGELAVYDCRYSLRGVVSTNVASIIGQSYSTTLATTDGSAFAEVLVTMGGVDITAEVYNAETGEINIPLVTGDLVITAKSESSSNYDVVLTPYDGSEEGELPFHKMDVTAGQTVIVTCFITKAQGYVYDGRSCGLQYFGSVTGGTYPIEDSQLNTEINLTLEIPTTGTLAFSGYHQSNLENGQLSTTVHDRAYGKYIKVKVEG